MQNYDSLSIRSAASFREEARRALRGKWKAALLVGLVLLLMAGSIIGAKVSYSSAAENAFGLDTLTASIGPFTSVSTWNDGKLFNDIWHSDSNYPIRLPYSPLFVAAAALTALLFVILSPVVSIAQVRLSAAVLDGHTPDFSILHVSGRRYWLFVRTVLLAYWLAFWPTLILCLCAGLAAAFMPDTPILIALPIIAGVILCLIRMLRYAAITYLITVRADITAREAVKASVQMMKGRKRRIVCLTLSFFGWELLYALFISGVQTLLGSTPIAVPAILLSQLAFVPLSVYLTVATTAFLRDADVRTNGWGVQAAQYEESAPTDALPESGESPAPDSSAQNAAESTPDDPWADDKQP